MTYAYLILKHWVPDDSLVVVVSAGCVQWSLLKTKDSVGIWLSFNCDIFLNIKYKVEYQILKLLQKLYTWKQSWMDD